MLIIKHLNEFRNSTRKQNKDINACYLLQNQTSLENLLPQSTESSGFQTGFRGT